MINKSFQLLRTNTALTTNIKMVVSSDYKLYLESFDTNKYLSDQKYKHFSLNKNDSYEGQIIKFYDGLSPMLAFSVKYDYDNSTVFSEYKNQFDDIYWSGAKSIEDNWYSEDFEYFAPLFIRKNSIPEGFVILRVDDSSTYSENNNELVVGKLDRTNFMSQIVNKWKCVSLFDMRYNTDLGSFLDKNYKNNSSYVDVSFDFDSTSSSKFYGIDYSRGVYTNKSKYLQSILKYEQPHFKLEKEILNSFRDNSLIYPNILNLKFLFNDVPADPINIKNYSINRYYGFYVDKLELVSKLTSYVTPEVRSGLTLKNNIFGHFSGTSFVEESKLSPFVEGFFLDKTYWVQLNNDFYQVVKINKNGIPKYQLVSDFDMSGYTFSSVNDRTCFINYISSGYIYNNNSISNPKISGTTIKNYISGYTSSFKIDPYLSGSTIMSMFADLYLIEIDGMYHVLKNSNGVYNIQTDYAINSYPDKLEYWKGSKTGKYYTKKDTYTYKNKPISYPVYRLKFSDIKDFDFDRVNTQFADFDYEKDVYYTTDEHKLYSTDYTDTSSLNKDFMTHQKGEDGQYKVMNVSSEYIADDELYEIHNNDLTDIWRKNQSVVKWGFAGSNSNCDYPYKFNNSIDIGDVFNSTCNVINSKPEEIEKNLDYFYRIGNLYSGSTSNTIKYLNQTTNIETDFNDTKNKKFNLGTYLDSKVDYFDYFFKNKENFTIDDVSRIKTTLKYSTFQSGDNYSPSNTLFKGLNINLIKIKSISRDSLGNIKNIIKDQTKNIDFNDYKFSIILNDVYVYYTNATTTTTQTSLAPPVVDFQYITGDVTPTTTIITSGPLTTTTTSGPSTTTTTFGSSTTTTTSTTKRNNYYEGGLTNNNVIDSGVNGIHVFLNEKFKNVLVVINVRIPIYTNNISLNNVAVFGEKYGLYNSKTLSGKSLIYPITGSTIKQYDPSILTANNFTDAFGDMNTLSSFDSGITYYYINSVGQSGSTGPINILNTNNTMKDVKTWRRVDPPFILEIVDPKKMETKKQSYINSAIKGPYTNIYDKYQIYYDRNNKQSYNVVEPLARKMVLNIQENNMNTIYASNKISTTNTIYRFNGSYEPIFKDISIFNNTILYYSGSTLNQWASNYKFDTQYENFGMMNEVICSKVNPISSPLKLTQSIKDRSIYPMVDEYGYQFCTRFIFNSSWDKDFYFLTSDEQNMKKSVFSNFSNYEYIIDPIKTKPIQ